jgi:hypothetical protein
MKKLLLSLLILSLAASAVAADGFSSLEEQMTGKEFTASGLDKLSAEELDALNNWIRSHSLGTLDEPRSIAAASTVQAEEVSGKDLRGLTDDKHEDDSPIRSEVLGEFEGWDGQTVFKLDNGMIWVQDDRDKFYVRDIENPIAVIESGMFDTWHLHIEGYDAQCKVKRIQ